MKYYGDRQPVYYAQSGNGEKVYTGNMGPAFSGLLMGRVSPTAVWVEVPLSGARGGGGGGGLGWNQNAGHFLWTLLVNNATPNARADVSSITGR